MYSVRGYNIYYYYYFYVFIIFILKKIIINCIPCEYEINYILYVVNILFVKYELKVVHLQISCFHKFHGGLLDIHVSDGIHNKY